MLIIDRSTDAQRLLVTVSEKSTVDQPQYQLNLHSSFTNTNYAFTLPGNTSEHMDRYDEFIMSTTSFSMLPVGTYEYSILEVTSSIVCETGILQVKDNLLSNAEQVGSEFTTYEPDQDDEEFITYTE